jgi:hypothetical protein
MRFRFADGKVYVSRKAGRLGEYLGDSLLDVGKALLGGGSEMADPVVFLVSDHVGVVILELFVFIA